METKKTTQYAINRNLLAMDRKRFFVVVFRINRLFERLTRLYFSFANVTVVAKNQISSSIIVIYTFRMAFDNLYFIILMVLHNK